MNTKLKYVGILALLPLFTLALSPDLIGTAEANGSTQKVYATEPIADFASYTGEPFVDVTSVSQFSGESPDTYKVTIKAHTGSLDIANVQILVKSDIDSSMTSINGMSALSSSVSTLMLKAKDPGSFTAEILGWALND